MLKFNRKNKFICKLDPSTRCNSAFWEVFQWCYIKCLDTCRHTSLCTHFHMYIGVHTHTCTYIHAYLHVYIHAYKLNILKKLEYNLSNCSLAVTHVWNKATDSDLCWSVLEKAVLWLRVARNVWVWVLWWWWWLKSGLGSLFQNHLYGISFWICPNR